MKKKLSLWIVCVLNNSKPKYWQEKWIFNEFGKPLSDYVILHLWSFLGIPNPKIFFKKIDRWDVIVLGIASPEHMMHVMYNSFSWSDTDRIGVHWTGISKKRNPLTHISCFHFSYCAVWHIQSCHMAHGKKVENQAYRSAQSSAFAHVSWPDCVCHRMKDCVLDIRKLILASPSNRCESKHTKITKIIRKKTKQGSNP